MAANPGKLVLSEFFSTKKIQFYANGYVHVSSIMGILDKGSVEKLVAVDGSAEVTKKTGLGRAAGAVLTMGFNLYSSNLRGNAFLNIVTESQTHSIMAEAPTPRDLKALNSIIATGKSLVLKAQQPTAPTTEPKAKAKPQDLAGQIKELEKLHKSGALTDAEFAKAKKKLLD